MRIQGLTIIRTGADFPDPRTAPGNYPLALGRELTPDLMLEGYRRGIFAWAVNPVTWWSPEPRAIFGLRDFALTRRLARKIRQIPFRITVDGAFHQVLRGCALPRPYEHQTWITPEFQAAFLELYHRGFAHSVECWKGDRVVGGVFGVAIGAFFSAESMFHLETDASKIAVYYLLQHLDRLGFRLFDIQVISPHTQSLGAHDIARAHYLSLLKRAIQLPAQSPRPCTLAVPP
jgi:leucyl/phenylalanyl-tRNA---protein transferase